MNLKATLIGLLEFREKILVDTKESDALLFGTHEQLVDAYLEELKPRLSDSSTPMPVITREFDPL